MLRVILAYMMALVPLNWLVCRYILGRREWAWLIVPFLALGFAVGVERAAAYDMGYDTSCDEIDLVELHGAYPRAHLSRFGSIYATSRIKFSIAFPNEPTALALPLDSGRSLRGEEVATSVWRSYPTPTLSGFQVQPRSLSMFRSEQMASLNGPITLVRDAQDKITRLDNQSELELRDAVLVDFTDVAQGERHEISLGTIAPGAGVELAGRPRKRLEKENELQRGIGDGLDPAPFLGVLRSFVEQRPENLGEIRLVAWSPGPRGGMTLEPKVDRHRGFSLVVVHLTVGAPPAPDGPHFNSLAPGAAEPSADDDFRRFYRRGDSNGGGNRFGPPGSGPDPEASPGSGGRRGFGAGRGRDPGTGRGRRSTNP